MASSRDSTFRSSETVAIVGVGLIGGSIAASLRKRGHTGAIVGVGRNQERLAEIRKAGLIDQGTQSLGEAASEADLIVVCTPVDVIPAAVREAATVCRPGTLLTDAGSVKGSICQALLGRLPPQAEFIGSHPLAGSERQGHAHADADLFEGRVCVVTPDAATSPGQLARLKCFWQTLGSAVVELSPEAHDRALAETSHLPHVVAAALAATLAPENRQFAATGFRDTTRIAASDPELWSAIFLANADEVLARLDAYDQRLGDLRTAITNRDAAALKKLLQVAKTAREALRAGTTTH
jgi:prephenate dehydrogenase